MSISTDRSVSKRTGIVVLLLAVSIFFLLMINFWPLGSDYVVYHTMASRFLHGETRLYDTPDQYYYAPWGMLIFAPLSLLPWQWGETLLNFTSIAVVAWSVKVFSGENNGVVPTVLALINLQMFDLMVRGQVDAIVLLGVVLAWLAIRDRRPWLLSVAFWLMSIKPTNVILPLLVVIWGTRKWPLYDWLRAISLPGISLGLSFLIIGFDWPLRWLDHVQRYPPPSSMISSVWRGAAVNSVPIWPLWLLVLPVGGWWIWRVAKYGVNITNFVFTMSLWMAISPYTLGYHYVMLAPALALVYHKWRTGAIGAYLLMFTPILRFFWGGRNVTWLDAFYPILLTIVLAVLTRSDNPIQVDN